DLFGADGEALADAMVYGLSVTSAASGLSTTDGSPIVLELLASGVVVGVVDGGAFDGQAAFAISIDPVSGLVTVEQYLSLDHPTEHDGTAGGSSYDEVLSLATGSLAVTVTITDGDGGKATESADVSGQISFADDGPSLTVVADTTVTAALDETAVSSTAATIDTGEI